MARQGVLRLAKGAHDKNPPDFLFPIFQLIVWKDAYTEPIRRSKQATVTTLLDFDLTRH